MSNFPPDGIDFKALTWNTDVEQDSVLANKIGQSSIHILSAGAGTVITDLMPAEGDAPYAIIAWVRGDSVTPGDDFRVQMAEFDASKIPITASNFGGPQFTAANTWQEEYHVITLTPTTRYMQIAFDKINTGWTAWVDYLAAEKVRRAFKATEGTVTSLVSGAFTKVTIDTEAYDYGSVFDHVTNNEFVARRNGLWRFGGGVGIVNVNADKAFAAAFFKNGTEAENGNWEAMSFAFGPVVTVVADMVLQSGDTVDLRAWNGDSVARNTLADARYSYFFGTEMR